jgi:hypothetical protein
MNTIPGVTFRPIHQWPGPPTKPYQRQVGRQFRATWRSTIDLLALELRQLHAKHIVLQLDLDERHIRQDGLPRANARPPDQPGVILSFESRHGPLRFHCDAYTWWETNLRVIALTMQALRAVDRYGVVKSGEQYRGWAQLPPPPPAAATMTPEEAAQFIAEHGRVPAGDWRSVLDDIAGERRRAYHAAAERLHPDTDSGDSELFVLLQQAKRILDQHTTGRR